MATKLLPVVGLWETEFFEVRGKTRKKYKERVTVKIKDIKKSTVEGTIELFNLDGTKVTDKYNFFAFFKNRILTGFYYPEDQNDFERGSFVLEFIHKDTLEGKYIFFTKNQGERRAASKYTWTRME